ncbi:MAG: helicase-related protein [Candidatus Micrarchaeaceae archaeon]
MPGDEWYKLGNAANFINVSTIEFREYQFNIIKKIFEGRNTIVILPTGLGKTLIGAFAIANALANGKRALFLAPTKPLSEQHFSTLSSTLKIDPNDILLLTGSLNRKARAQAEARAKVIVATPQTVANDLKSAAFSMQDFGVAIFDECHRAVGRYAYTYVSGECTAHGVQIVGLTASPGGNKEKISKLLNALSIEDIEVRTSADKDVVGYVLPKYVHIVSVEKSALIGRIAALLEPLIQASLTSLNKMGLLYVKRFQNIPKGRLIALGDEIMKIKAQNFRFGAFASYIKLLNLLHAYDLLQTEGLYPFVDYLNRLGTREKKSKALISLLSERNIAIAKSMAESAMRSGIEHPKTEALLNQLAAYRGKSTIVFAQYRSTIKMLVDLLLKKGFAARAFVGKREGVTQEAQKQTIADFREKKFDVLVASSIGEEGLDIPAVDLVIFYEPIPNEIRNIQRRGRAGRVRAGDIVVLTTNDTKDMTYLFVSMQRERKMLYIINKLKEEMEERRIARASGQMRL